ncbi:MAG: hypothetical protein ACJ0PT_00460 [Flavobacteriales bacterium]
MGPNLLGGSSTNNTTICLGDFFMVGPNMYTKVPMVYAIQPIPHKNRRFSFKN